MTEDQHAIGQEDGTPVEEAAAIPQDILNDPHLLGLPDDLVPWMAVTNNSYAHYKEHEASVRAWLDAHKRPGEDA